jgi:hypothetical protein
VCLVCWSISKCEIRIKHKQDDYLIIFVQKLQTLFSYFQESNNGVIYWVVPEHWTMHNTTLNLPSMDRSYSQSYVYKFQVHPSKFQECWFIWGVLWGWWPQDWHVTWTKNNFPLSFTIFIFFRILTLALQSKLNYMNVDSTFHGVLLLKHMQGFNILTFFIF